MWDVIWLCIESQEIWRTSWMWSLESSVKAIRSCRLIPASTKNILAPSRIVSVRSNFFWTCQFIDLCQENMRVLVVRHIIKSWISLMSHGLSPAPVFHLQCWIIVHLSHIFLSKDYEIFKPFPLEHSILEQNLCI